MLHSINNGNSNDKNLLNSEDLKDEAPTIVLEISFEEDFDLESLDNPNLETN